MEVGAQLEVLLVSEVEVYITNRLDPPTYAMTDIAMCGTEEGGAVRWRDVRS